MKRMILAVIVGYVVWTGLWLGGNALFFGEAAAVVGAGEAYTKVGPLSGVIGLSIVCSLAAGLVAARVARGRASRTVPIVLIVAILLLLTGIGVQAGVWALMPAWYHLTFLILIVPIVALGGRFAHRAH